MPLRVLKGVSPLLSSVGKALEKQGKQLGKLPPHVPETFGVILTPPADSIGESAGAHAQVQEKKPGFVAPWPAITFEASEAKGAALADDSSIWYGATVGKSLKLGALSTVLDHSEVGSDVSIGSYVKIGARSVVEDGVEVADRVAIGAGSKISKGVKITSDVVVSPGSVVSSSITSAGLFEGIPAVFVRELKPEEISEYIVNETEHIGKLAEVHKTEHEKSLWQREQEKIDFSERSMYVNTVMEDRQGAWDTFVAFNPKNTYNPKRRGLIFNKHEE